MPANRVSAITVRPRKRRTDSDSAALGPEGRCASGWEPPLRGGRRHFPHWASSMKGVLRTRGWQPVTGGPDHESRATNHRFMPLVQSGKMSLARPSRACHPLDSSCPRICTNTQTLARGISRRSY